MFNLARHSAVDDFRKKFKVFQWHGDTFDLPMGAVHLCKSSMYENQAFRYRDNVYAFQFHIEVNEKLLTDWFKDHPLKEKILKDTCNFISEYSKRAKNFYKMFFT